MDKGLSARARKGVPGVNDLGVSRGVPRRRTSCKVVVRRSKRRGNVFSVVGRVDLRLSVLTWLRERQARASSFVQCAHFSTSRDVVRVPAVDGGVI